MICSQIKELAIAGIPFVQLPKTEFEALLEHIADLEDLQSIRMANTNRLAGEEALPLECTRRILLGESPIKVYRELRGLTQMSLATRAGVNRAYLSEIETGKKPGSAQVLKAIANALSVNIEDLIS